MLKMQCKLKKQSFDNTNIELLNNYFKFLARSFQFILINEIYSKTPTQNFGKCWTLDIGQVKQRKGIVAIQYLLNKLQDEYSLVEIDFCRSYNYEEQEDSITYLCTCTDIMNC